MQPELFLIEGKVSVLKMGASTLNLLAPKQNMGNAIAKSLCQIEPYKDMMDVDKAVDVIRGGLKMTAGAMSAAAGGIPMVLDYQSLKEEYVKNEPTGC